MRLRFSIREKLAELDIISRWVVYFVAIFSILIFGVYGPEFDIKNFIYGAF
jgi:hypothetical protein